eukprot:3973389-Pleurochrysis_carterae.AAC.1
MAVVDFAGEQLPITAFCLACSHTVWQSPALLTPRWQEYPFVSWCSRALGCPILPSVAPIERARSSTAASSRSLRRVTWSKTMTPPLRHKFGVNIFVDAASDPDVRVAATARPLHTSTFVILRKGCMLEVFLPCFVHTYAVCQCASEV